MFPRLVAALLAITVSGNVMAEDSSANSFKMLTPTEPLNAAAGFAYTQGLFVAKLTTTCKTLPEPMPAEAENALASWRNRNVDLVEAAYFWVRYVGVLIKSQQGQEAADAFLRSAIAEFETQSDLALKDRFPSGNPDVETCHKWMSLLSGTGVDLRNPDVRASREFIADLETILAFQHKVDAQVKK